MTWPTENRLNNAYSVLSFSLCTFVVRMVTGLKSTYDLHSSQWHFKMRCLCEGRRQHWGWGLLWSPAHTSDWNSLSAALWTATYIYTLSPLAFAGHLKTHLFDWDWHWQRAWGLFRTRSTNLCIIIIIIYVHFLMNVDEDDDEHFFRYYSLVAGAMQCYITRLAIYAGLCHAILVKNEICKFIQGQQRGSQNSLRRKETVTKCNSQPDHKCNRSSSQT